MAEIKNSSSDVAAIVPWFNVAGPGDDVILSTRVRLARNLADFPFSRKLKEEDRQRIVSLAYDAFSSDQQFHYIDWNSIAAPGREILRDKNIIKDKKNYSLSAVLLHEDECTSALVNESDHIRIAAFVSGLDTEKAMQKVYKVDEFLQEKLQFAASYEFGYLTSHIKDCGTGMKISLRVFIPSIVFSGKFNETVDLITQKKFCIQPVFKAGEKADFSNCIFDIFPGSSCEGTELDQMAAMQALGQLILKTERKIRSQFADNNPTIVLNFVKRNYSLAMTSLLISYEEGVSITGALKWGIQTGVITGVSENNLNALYFRTKHGHLLYLSDNYAFSFEEDVKSDQELQIQRLRTVVIQQALENVTFKK